MAALLLLLAVAISISPSSSQLSTWELMNADAPVGKLFEYHLVVSSNGGADRTVLVDGSGDDDDDDESYVGGKQLPLKVYQINSYGERTSLPKWLLLNETTGMLYGVPDESLLGQMYRILVDYATGETDNFEIGVIDDTSASWTDTTDFINHSKTTSSDAAISPVLCPRGLALTTAIIVFDLDIQQLSAADKVDLIVDLGRHFSLPLTVFRVRRVSSNDRPLLEFNNALAAGPGDVDPGTVPLRPVVQVDWNVGCGNVRSEMMPALEILETTASDGRLGRAIRHRPAVVGWQIIKSSRGTVARRYRSRYMAPSKTPAVPIAVMPTARTDIVTVTVPSPPATKTVVIVPSITWFTDDRRPLMTSAPSTQDTSGRYDDEWWSTRDGDTLMPSTPSSFDQQRPMESTTSLPSRSTWPTTLTPTRRTKRPPKTTPSPPEVQMNEPPVVMNPIGRLEATAGRMFWFPIPNRTFVDDQDGDVSQLLILFQTFEGLTVTPMSWIKLNQTSKTLIGMPVDTDVGHRQYFLVAVDSDGRVTKHAFEIVVQRGPSTERISHEFSVVLDLDFDEFHYNGVEKRIEVTSRIASAYNDATPGLITVTSISRGSVVYSWTNNTIPEQPPCPVDQIQQVAERVINPNDGSPNSEFVAAMHPINVKSTSFRPLGPCADNEQLVRLSGGQTPPPAPVSSPSVPAGGPEVVAKPATTSGSVDTLLLIVIISMVVVGFLLVILIILCVVCCCRARRQSDKQRRQREDELTCANKGIPVIFADELNADGPGDDDDDCKSAATVSRNGHDNGGGSKTPDESNTPASTLKRRVQHADDVEIGRDEGPPPPPDYPRSDAASRTSTLKSDYKAPLISESEDDDDEGMSRDATLARPPNTNSLPPYQKL